jgi:hypothetical protein
VSRRVQWCVSRYFFYHRKVVNIRKSKCKLWKWKLTSLCMYLLLSLSLILMEENINFSNSFSVRQENKLQIWAKLD